MGSGLQNIGRAHSISEPRAKREAMSIEETTIYHMCEITAIVEVLERKGLCMALVLR